MAASNGRKAKWPFAPKDIGTNRDTNLLKLIAMITMLIDHTAAAFVPRGADYRMIYMIMRYIGRLAFPIYAYCIAVGCVYSRNRLKYLSRILLMGLVSQPFYAIALNHTVSQMFAIPFLKNPLGAILNFYIYSWKTPNIMLTLAMGLLLIWSIRDRQLVCTAALALLTWKLQGSINYGWHGVLLIVLFYLTIQRWWISLPVMGAYMLWWGMSGSSVALFGWRFDIQIFAMLALPLIYIPTYSKLKINKWVYYLYYPGHLIGLMLVQFALKLGKG